jgi:hypothetical protein
LKGAIEQALPQNSRLFSFAGRPAAYINRDIVVGYESTEGLRIQAALEKAAASNSNQREAALVAKSAGCGFLLVNDSDSVSANINSNLNTWGLAALAKTNGTTFYRID